MSTMKQKVFEVLTRLNGTVPGELTRLTADYVPGDTAITVSEAKANINPGTLVSVGLNTLYVTRVADGGLSFDVMPVVASATGALAGDIVRFRPAQTDAEVFDRLSTAIRAMSSPEAGLYRPAIVESGIDYVGARYSVPASWTVDPVRVLSVQFVDSLGDWLDVDGWTWKPEDGVVQLLSNPPGALSMRVVYALPFAAPSSLDDDLADLGIHESMQDIPVLGACVYLALGLEGRRIIPTSQSDTRRANEVSMTAGTSLAREWRRAYNDRVNEEATRLSALYGYRFQRLP